MKTRIIQDNPEPTESLALEGPEAAPQEPADRPALRLRYALIDRRRTARSAGSSGVDDDHRDTPKP